MWRIQSLFSRLQIGTAETTVHLDYSAPMFLRLPKRDDACALQSCWGKRETGIGLTALSPLFADFLNIIPKIQPASCPNLTHSSNSTSKLYPYFPIHDWQECIANKENEALLLSVLRKAKFVSLSRFYNSSPSLVTITPKIIHCSGERGMPLNTYLNGEGVRG